VAFIPYKRNLATNARIDVLINASRYFDLDDYKATFLGVNRNYEIDIIRQGFDLEKNLIRIDSQ